MNLNIKSLSLIFAIVIICAYIFGNVMFSVFKYKLDDLFTQREGFKSIQNNLNQEEEIPVSNNSQLNKIFQVLPYKNILHL